MNLSDKDFETFCENLGFALQKPLPGRAAQLKMASDYRRGDMETDSTLISAVKSAVLIAFFPANGSIFFPLILRPAYDGIHANQVSFPGGRMERSDASVIETALREAEEELNINKNSITLLGHLTNLYIPPSNYLVTPVIGFSSSAPELRPDPLEVAQVIVTDVRHLLNKNYLKEKEIHVGNLSIRAPYFDINGHTVWGATAMMLSELKEIIETF